MSTLTIQELKQFAKLANLELTDKELDFYLQDLPKIILLLKKFNS